MNETIERIKDFADKAHGDQKRKYTPDRYIVHPIRVMNICSAYSTSLPVLAAALLHDVLEDTPITKDEIYQFLLQVMSKDEAHETIELVVALTDVYTKARYPNWNRKKRKQEELRRITFTSPDAQTIKYADIIDNCKEIVSHDPDFAKVFMRECRTLLRQINKGNATLYQQAKETVDTALEQVYSNEAGKKED